MPDVHITDAYAVRNLVWDFDPAWEFEYSERELHLMAEKLLLDDAKPYDEAPYWLSCEQLRRRQKREVQTSTGTPDPAIVSGLYWRTHPEGRSARLDSRKRADTKASFYKDGGGGTWS